jgi:hypothetical protein
MAVRMNFRRHGKNLALTLTVVSVLGFENPGGHGESGSSRHGARPSWV